MPNPSSNFPRCLEDQAPRHSPGLTLPVGIARPLYTNARLSNLLDLDETYPVGVHFGGAAVCTAPTASESESKSSADMVVGIVAGYEAGARIASAVGTMMTVRGGQAQGFSNKWGVAAPVAVAATSPWS